MNVHVFTLLFRSGAVYQSKEDMVFTPNSEENENSSTIHTPSDEEDDTAKYLFLYNHGSFSYSVVMDTISHLSVQR